jgi:hypothetical protein
MINFEYPRARTFTSVVAGFFLLWLAAVIVWIGPSVVWENATSIGSTSARTLGEIGDSFGIATAVFSGAAVVLVFLTYVSQKEELRSLREHFGLEQRRQRVSYLVERLERQLRVVSSGELAGADLIRWMNRELSTHFALEVALPRTAAQRWLHILDELPPLPDVEPLSPAAYTIQALSKVAGEIQNEGEMEELAALTRSVISTDSLIPLLYCVAKTLRGRPTELVGASLLFRSLGLRPIVISAFDLSAVPGGVPATIDDTLVGPEGNGPT